MYLTDGVSMLFRMCETGDILSSIVISTETVGIAIASEARVFVM
jgi:hypothetical protein